jgi:hypothetical protein
VGVGDRGRALGFKVEEEHPLDLVGHGQVVHDGRRDRASCPEDGDTHSFGEGHRQAP